MYNKLVKEDFIEYYLRQRVIAETSLYSIFRKTEPYERELDKDVCLFSKDEFIEMYKGFNAKSLDVIANYMSIVRMYGRWEKAINRFEMVSDAYETLTKEDVKDCVNQDIINSKIISRGQIEDIEDQCLNYSDKAIIECLWHGIVGKGMNEIVSLDARKIDHSRKVVILDNREIKLTDRFYDILMKAFDEKEYVCYGETMKVKILEGNGLYKERDNAHAAPSEDKNFRWVYRRIQNIRNYVDCPSLTMKNITSSGMLDALQMEMLNKNMTLRQVVRSEDGARIMTQYGYDGEHRVDIILNKFANV